MENQAKNTLRLRFLGAIGTVTGSCTLLEYYCCDNKQRKYFLIDAGSFQNENNSAGQEDERNKVLKNIAKDIEKIFITHAHLDHIGILPEIIEYGFRGEVCCTQATHELIMTMLTHGEDDESNLKLLKKITFFDIDGRHGDKQNNGFGKTYIPITHDFIYGYLRSSHVLGSCTISFQWTEKNYQKKCSEKEKEWKYIYFSGDIGPVTDKVMANIMFKGHQTPYWDKHDKCIVMESTYGDKIRVKENLFKRKIDKLSEIIDTTISRDGTVVIPAFALDRAQQILVDLFYIFKNKETNVSSTDDDTWKNILKKHRNNAMCKNIVTGIKTLEGKDKKALRKKINKEIEQTLKTYGYTPEYRFSEISEDCQNSITEIFEKEKIQKSLMDKKQNKLNFHFDSPLIEKINKVYLNHITDEAYSAKDKKRKFKYLSDYFFKYFDIPECEIAEQKKKITRMLSSFFKKKENEPKIKIIVSASGMCEEGSITNLLKEYLQDEKAAIILTGFQASQTNGWLLKNLMKGKYDGNNEKDRIPLKLKKNVEFRLADVKCAIKDMSEYYSGHADQEQLLDYITPDERNTGNNITVLLNHGADSAREALKTKIEERNNKIKVLLPEFNKWFNVVTSEYEPEDIEFKKEINNQFSFIPVSDIHIYYPIGFDNEKLQAIIDYIKKL